MKLIIDIPMDAYSMIMDTTFTECEETMFLQTPEDRLKTMLLFKTLGSIKNGTPYEDRPQGEWIENTNIFGEGTYECSNCGNPWSLMEGTPADNDMNYCPNCGAKMKKEAENDI